MSLHFILDGYNILHSTDRWGDMGREERRLAFLNDVEKNSSQGSARNTITVVLDGRAAALNKVSFFIVNLVFSGDQDADTVIKERVAQMRNPRDAVVVTNDRGLRDAVRGKGGQVMTSEEFWQSHRQKKTPSSHQQKPDPAAMTSVNAELKRFWKLD